MQQRRELTPRAPWQIPGFLMTLKLLFSMNVQPEEKQEEDQQTEQPHSPVEAAPRQ